MLANIVGALLTMIVLLCAAASIPRLPPSASAQTITNQLVKASGPAVYYVGDDNKRYVFPNERIFFTWYRDFSSVQTISDSQLASFPIGGNVFYRPGTRLVKITTDPKVYAVGPGGSLYDIASEAAALRLYGTTWSQRVDDLPDAFFSSYRAAGSLNGESHPVGTFFRYVENTSYYVLGYAESTLFARQISENLISTFRLNKANALALRSSDFGYNIGPNWTAEDQSFFLPHQPAAPVIVGPDTGNPSTPGDNGGAPAPTAAITLSRHPSLASSVKAVVRDPASRVFAFTIKGDPAQPVAISLLRFNVYIDGGGADKDFSLGSDSDETLFWPANQVLSDFALRDMDTGAVVASARPLDSSGILEFPVSLTLAPGASRNIELTAEAQIVPQAAVRLSADINPKNDVGASVNGAAPAVNPAANLNGGTSPSTIIIPVEHGSLTVSSKNETGDSLQLLSQPVRAYTLTLTATGEPFLVSGFSLGFVAGGGDLYAIESLTASYPIEDGTTDKKIQHEIDVNAASFRYINLPIYVPKDKTATVTFTAAIKDDPTLYSNSRLQFDFLTEGFNAQSVYTNRSFTGNDFADTAKLSDKTTPGSLTILRQGFISISSHPEAPNGRITRYNKLPVLTFSVTAKEHDVSIRQISVRVDSSDIDEDGDDNDFFERIANTFPNEAIGVSTHHLDINERDVVPVSSTKFLLYDASTGGFDDTPDGIQTAPGDYGLFIINFGSSPITISKGTTSTFDVDINTTLISFEHEESIKARLLGDGKSTPQSQANFLWNDGTNVLGTGYLVPGLDLQGFTLTVF